MKIGPKLTNFDFVEFNNIWRQLNQFLLINPFLGSDPSIFKNTNKIIKNDKAEVLNIISFLLRNFHGNISEK